MDYPLGEDVYELIKLPQAKTICSDFDEQLDISEQLYKNNLKFHFTKSDVKALLEKAENYSKEDRERVETVIYEQMRKYTYLFEKNI